MKFEVCVMHALCAAFILVLALCVVTIIAGGLWCYEKVKEIVQKVAEAKGGAAGRPEADIPVLQGAEGRDG